MSSVECSFRDTVRWVVSRSELAGDRDGCENRDCYGVWQAVMGMVFRGSNTLRGAHVRRGDPFVDVTGSWV